MVPATEGGFLPTVGVRTARSPAVVPVPDSAVRPPDLDKPVPAIAERAPDPVRAAPVGPSIAGARRLTEVVLRGRAFAAAATEVREGAVGEAVGVRRRAVRPVVPVLGLFLY